MAGFLTGEIDNDVNNTDTNTDGNNSGRFLKGLQIFSKITTDIKESIKVLKGTTTPEVTIDDVALNKENANDNAPKGDAKNGFIYIAIAVFSVIVIGGTVIYFVTKSRKNKQ